MTELIIRPRRTGKTTDLINKFRSVSSKSIFITPHKNQIPDIIHQFNLPSDRGSRITTQEFFNKSIPREFQLLGHKTPVIENYFIDEYFSMPLNAKKEIFRLAQQGFNITAIGTPVIQYKLKEVEACKLWHSTMIQGGVITTILLSYVQMCEKYTEELMNNLLVLPGGLVRHYMSEADTMCKEQFEMEILGRIIK